MGGGERFGSGGIREGRGIVVSQLGIMALLNRSGIILYFFLPSLFEECSV